MGINAYICNVFNIDGRSVFFSAKDGKMRLKMDDLCRGEMREEWSKRGGIFRRGLCKRSKEICKKTRFCKRQNRKDRTEFIGY